MFSQEERAKMAAEMAAETGRPLELCLRATNETADWMERATPEDQNRALQMLIDGYCAVRTAPDPGAAHRSFIQRFWDEVILKGK